jgi:hypothetical protein
VTYEKVLFETEHADEEAKNAKRLPRSYEESVKKLKTVKIVTKKGDVATDENKKKKTKQMATSNKQSVSAVQKEEIEEEEQEIEAEEENVDEQKDIEETKEELSVDQEDKERAPLGEVQQSTMSVAEKLQAIGKKPAPFSKTAAKYERKKSFEIIFICCSLVKLHRKQKKVNQKRFKLNPMQVKWIQMDLIIRKKQMPEK